jgi:hypothetical protein
MDKVNTAWRTEKAVKTNKGARDLSRAARPEAEKKKGKKIIFFPYFLSLRPLRTLRLCVINFE